MDVLSALLREMRLESVHYRQLELRAPFRVAFEQARLRGVHIIAHGECELAMRGLSARRLRAGDLVLMPRADPHQLSSVGGKHAALEHSTELEARRKGSRTRGGGAGAETQLVCGAFVFHEGDHPALAALPRLIHVRGEGGRPAPWVATFVDALTREARDGGPGSEVVMARISDALIARALRESLDVAGEAGWLRGLRDPQLARLLGALHDDLARSWSLPEMARVAGLSRAAFAARFNERIGEPPMQYLRRCRMRRAESLLREAGSTLLGVAASVGYGSEAALSAAFKRYAGHAPRALSAERRGRAPSGARKAR